MIDGLLARAPEIYAYVYFGTVLVVALVEWAVPRRRPGETFALRWFNNVAISILDTIVVRAIFPIAVLAWATLCSQRRWGLLNRLELPAAADLLITFVVLDFLHYGQHYLLHRIPVLWRLHRTHHSDREYDLTTGVRFHPFEAIFTTALQLLVVFLLGAPPAVVFVAQIAFLAVSFVEHANIRMPRAAERIVRVLFVTPEMHRIHHSQTAGENRSNLSNLFSWWDRLFATYVAEPAVGHEQIAFGLPEFQERKHTTLPWMLAQPFLPESDATTTTPNAEASCGGSDATATAHR